MSEVAAWACEPLIDAVEAIGLPPGVLMDGLSVSMEKIRKRATRVTWSDYAAMIERAAEILGGPADLENAFTRFEPHHPWGWGLVKVFCGNFLSSRPLYLLGASWVGPSTFTSTRARCADLPDGRIRQVVEIVPPYRDCELFFLSMRGVLRATPRIIGQTDARVEMMVEPRRAIYTITPPRRIPLASRLRLRRASQKVIANAFSELGDTQEELHESLREARLRGESLRAQTLRLETINQLSRKLAQHTNLGELANAVLELLREYFQFDGARLSVAPRDGGSLEVVRLAGKREAEPNSTHTLQTSTGTVGRIDLWGATAEPAKDSAALLTDVLPWIALALDNARSFSDLNAQTQRLEVEISERQRTEQQLQQAMRMEAVGRLAGGLAHDFNNVLTAIVGHAELASSELRDGDPAREDIEQICAVSERAGGLISQVLAFSRHQVLHTERLDLNALLLGMESMLRHLVRENVELVILPGEHLGAVVADAARLEQVVVNLVANARDAMPEGGRLVIETANVRVGATAQRSRPKLAPGRYVRLEVRDTGQGMDAPTSELIFEPFFTTKGLGEGTGLGLSTSYGTITQLGGAIELESELGKGTAIAILLPRAAGETEALTAEAADEPSCHSVTPIVLGTETVLLVEDESAVRRVTRRVLESRGYTVLEAESGQAALEICKSYRETIHLLLSDVVMPGLDGRELARRILPMRPDIRAVIHTSGYEGGSAVGSVPHSPDVSVRHSFLRKPYLPAEILSEIRRVLDAT